MDSIEVMRAVETPLSKVVEGLTENLELKEVFFSYCTLHGVRPTETPFGLHAIMMDSIIRGPYGFAKGGDALTQKYVEVIKAQGGQVLTKKRVTKNVSQTMEIASSS